MKTNQLVILCIVIVLTGIGAAFAPGIYARAYPSGPGASLWEECATFTLRFNFKEMEGCVALTEIMRREDPNWLHVNDPRHALNQR